MTNHTHYTYIGDYHSLEIEYEPKDYLGIFDWFNIATCARARMTEHCHNMTRWRGERRSFYSSIQAMDIDTKHLRDWWMTDEEYMQQIAKEWERLDDDPELSDDFFDYINFEEDLCSQ